MATASAQGTEIPASVAFTHRGTVSEGIFRVDNECFVQPKATISWGWRTSQRGREISIEAEGRTIRVEADRQGRIPLLSALSQLGAQTEWNTDGTKLRVYGSIRQFDVSGGTVALSSTLSFSPQSFTLDSPDRLVIDLPGTRLSPGLNAPSEGKVRIRQFTADTVRLVIESPGITKLQPNLNVSRSLEITVSNLNEGTSILNAGGSKTSSPPSQDAAVAVPDVVVRPPILSADGRDIVTAYFELSDTTAARIVARYLDPLTIEIAIPGGQIEPEVWKDLPDHNLIKGFEAIADPGVARIRVYLKQALGMGFSRDSGSFSLTMLKPPSASGTLKGKVITLDAGHGGNDSGALSTSKKVREKDLTLDITRAIAAELTREGATVILTRNSDVRIPLKERAEIANESSSDIFVSVHINSNKVSNARAGSMTFYHKSETMGRILATCLQAEIGKIASPPGIGVRSDSTLYQSGLAVLRYSRMPAVLLELGFINHSSDLKAMTDSEYAKKVAAAVRQGLKTYFGDAGNLED